MLSLDDFGSVGGTLRRWVEASQRGPIDRPFLYLVGGSGCGKTAMAEALVRHFGDSIDSLRIDADDDGGLNTESRRDHLAAIRSRAAKCERQKRLLLVVVDDADAFDRAMGCKLLDELHDIQKKESLNNTLVLACFTQTHKWSDRVTRFIRACERDNSRRIVVPEPSPEHIRDILVKDFAALGADRLLEIARRSLGSIGRARILANLCGATSIDNASSVEDMARNLFERGARSEELTDGSQDGETYDEWELSNYVHTMAPVVAMVADAPPLPSLDAMAASTASIALADVARRFRNEKDRDPMSYTLVDRFAIDCAVQPVRGLLKDRCIPSIQYRQWPSNNITAARANRMRATAIGLERRQFVCERGVLFVDADPLRTVSKIQTSLKSPDSLIGQRLLFDKAIEAMKIDGVRALSSLGMTAEVDRRDLRETMVYGRETRDTSVEQYSTSQRLRVNLKNTGMFDVLPWNPLPARVGKLKSAAKRQLATGEQPNARKRRSLASSSASLSRSRSRGIEKCKY